MSELADSTPRSPFSSASRMMTPLASPVKNAITSMQTYLKEVGHLTKLDPQDSWLPITESRNGNAYYAAFHTLSSGIGFQALLLPLAFTTLGWGKMGENTGPVSNSLPSRWNLPVILAQLPNLNSIAGISLVSAITAVTYCTLTWVLGHNLVLEIQGTMPSTDKNPSSLPMWKGVRFSYMIIACCLFPMAHRGLLGLREFDTPNGGMLSVLDKYHRNDTPRVVLGLTSLFFLINSLTSFQIYAMPAFDNMEFSGSAFLKTWLGLLEGLPYLLRLHIHAYVGLGSRNPQRYSSMWWLNWDTRISGNDLEHSLVFGAI
ncbi:hypothetical protein SASPL_149762 [Salvia splendens]|uniref:Uncharacterized protein n=1 Tax=Salvia splendens TaxID=180675 RepID=A0A8X8Z294_SALSN|nr:hypothetical protein SASPL_149762 [Salvia splendens]